MDGLPDAHLLRCVHHCGQRAGVRGVVDAGAKLAAGIAKKFEAELVGEASLTAPSSDIVIGDGVGDDVPPLNLRTAFAGGETEVGAKANLGLCQKLHCGLPVVEGRAAFPDQRALAVLADGVWPVEFQAVVQRVKDAGERGMLQG